MEKLFIFNKKLLTNHNKKLYIVLGVDYKTQIKNHYFIKLFRRLFIMKKIGMLLGSIILASALVACGEKKRRS